MILCPTGGIYGIPGVGCDNNEPHPLDIHEPLSQSHIDKLLEQAFAQFKHMPSSHNFLNLEYAMEGYQKRRLG